MSTYRRGTGVYCLGQLAPAQAIIMKPDYPVYSGGGRRKRGCIRGMPVAKAPDSSVFLLGNCPPYGRFCLPESAPRLLTENDALAPPDFLDMLPPHAMLHIAVCPWILVPARTETSGTVLIPLYNSAFIGQHADGHQALHPPLPIKTKKP